MRWLFVKDMQILKRSPLLVGLLIVYPIAIALMTVVIGGLYVRETNRVRIWDEVGGESESAAVAGVAAGDASAVAGQ